MTNAETPCFKVGDGVHDGYNGDSYPGTVRKVSPSGKTVWVSHDDYSVKPGHTTYGQEGPVECDFTPKNAGKPDTWVKFTYRTKSNTFSEAGLRGWYLSHGRRYSRNPSF